MMAKCSYTQHGNLEWSCPYPEMEGGNGLCIFHATVENKSSDQFNKAIKPIIEVANQKINQMNRLATNVENYSDNQLKIIEIALQDRGRFCGFIFPDGLSISKCTLVGADFSYAAFFGDVRFWTVGFATPAKFDQARFDCDTVSFDSSSFTSGFSFSGASFNASEGVGFHGIVCAGERASFIGASFAGKSAIFSGINITTNVIDFSQVKVTCDGNFHISGNMTAKDLISFERSDFYSPIRIVANLIAPRLNMENVRFQEAQKKSPQQSLIRGRIECSIDSNWDNISCSNGHELLLCKSHFVGNHSFTDCNHATINLSSCVIDEHADVLFQNCDMDSFHFSKIDLVRVRFLACSWPRRKGVAFIADDPTKGGEIKGWYSYFGRLFNSIRNRKLPESWTERAQGRLAESERLYRQLKVKYDSMGEPSLAGDFYLREMQMKTMQLGYISSFPLLIYNLLSGYGEHWKQAGLLWVLIWLVGAWHLMLQSSDADYFLKSIQAMLLLTRGGNWDITLLNIFGPIQTGFFALALKRRFRRY